MALIQPGPLVASISGSLAGTTFRTTRFGIVAGSRARNPNRETLASTRAHASYAMVSQLWPTLLPYQRQNWRIAAMNLNRARRLFGAATFSGYELYLYQGLSYRAAFDAPNIWPSLDGLAALTQPFHLTWVEGGPYDLHFWPPLAPVKHSIHPWVAQGLRSTPITYARLWHRLPERTFLGTLIDLYADVSAILGPLAAGDAVGLRVPLRLTTEYFGRPTTVFTQVLPSP